MGFAERISSCGSTAPDVPVPCIFLVTQAARSQIGSTLGRCILCRYLPRPSPRFWKFPGIFELAEIFRQSTPDKGVKGQVL
jgi:hypothetical protein